MPTFAPLGNAIFGQTNFGAPPRFGFGNILTIAPYGYTGLQLSWLPSGGTWTAQILVRSSFGIPVGITDGVTILNETQGPFSVGIVDNNLRPGLFYYYGLFVFNPVTNSWVQAGTGQGLVITNWDFADTYMGWLPNWYLDQDSTLATQTTSGPLERFLQLLGYEMDWVRSEIQSLFLLSNVEYIPGSVLPYLAGNYGVQYEPELGMRRSRVLVQNAVHLYKTKGTRLGVTAAASSFSGFGCAVTIGKNLEIQLDDSTFDRSFGHWTNLTNCTLTTGPASLGTTPPYASYLAVTPPVMASTISSAFYLPANNENVGVVTGTGGAVTLATGTAGASAQTIGLPVTQQATPPIYVLSGYFQPILTLRAWRAQINWYDINGAFLSSQSGALVTEQAGVWTRCYVAASPPAGAYFFHRQFFSPASLGNGERHLFSSEQVEINTQATPGPTAWDPPRDIKINLYPSRQNLVPDPVGRGGGFGISATGATLSEITGSIP